MVTGGNFRYLTDEILSNSSRKCRVFSDSVLCIGAQVPIIVMQQELGKKIESQILSKARSIDHSTTITSEPVEFGRMIHVARTSIEILEYIQKMLAEEGVQPAQFTGRVIFIQLVAKQERKRMPSKKQYVLLRSQKISNQDDGHFSDLETKKNGTEACSKKKTMVKWNSTAEIVKQEFAQSGVFKCSSPTATGVLKSEGSGHRSITTQTQVPQKCV